MLVITGVLATHLPPCRLLMDEKVVGAELVRCVYKQDIKTLRRFLAAGAEPDLQVRGFTQLSPAMPSTCTLHMSPPRCCLWL
jgi:hypothetical protein